MNVRKLAANPFGVPWISKQRENRLEVVDIHRDPVRPRLRSHDGAFSQRIWRVLESVWPSPWCHNHIDWDSSLAEETTARQCLVLARSCFFHRSGFVARHCLFDVLDCHRSLSAGGSSVCHLYGTVSRVVCAYPLLVPVSESVGQHRTKRVSE